MEPFVHQEKGLVLILLNQTQNLAWVCILMLIIVISLLMEKKCEFKAGNKNVNFPTQFCLGSISNRFSATESREVSFNGSVYYFSITVLLINLTY